MSPRTAHAAASAVVAVGDKKNLTSSLTGLSFFSWAKLQTPYRDGDYTFQTVGKMKGKLPCDDCDLGKIPRGWEQEVFDDSGWNSGTAAFSGVSPFGSGRPTCDLDDTVVTDWPAADPRFNPPQQTHILLRKQFFVRAETGTHPASEAVGLQVRIAGRNDFRAYLNGTEITGFVTEPPGVRVKRNGFVEREGGCPVYDEIIFTVPESLIRLGADNLLAIHGRSRLDEPSFIDVQVNVIEGS